MKVYCLYCIYGHGLAIRKACKKKCHGNGEGNDNCATLQPCIKCSDCTHLLISFMLSFLAPVCIGAPSGQRSEPSQPWHQPCAGDTGKEGSVLSGILDDVPIPRSPEWDDPSKFAHEMLILLAGTEQIVDALSSFLIQEHFGENDSHVNDLNNLPFLHGFEIENEEALRSTTRLLADLYEGVVRATIFLDTMRNDVAGDRSMRTSKEDRMSDALEALSFGGWDGRQHHPAGLHQLLCKLYVYLAANGLNADTSHLNQDTMPLHMRTPPSRADRHNRDYLVLRNIQHLLSNFRGVLRDMHISD